MNWLKEYKNRWYVRGINIGLLLLLAGFSGGTVLLVIHPAFGILPVIMIPGFFLLLICSMAHLADSKKRISRIRTKMNNNKTEPSNPPLPRAATTRRSKGGR